MFIPHFPTSALANNQFTTGGIMLMAITSFIAFVKGLPAKLWAWVLRQCTVMITVADNDASFEMVKEWITVLPFTKKSRRIDLNYINKDKGVRLNMGPGTHLFWYQSRPVWFYFTRGDKQNSKEKTESFSFRTVGRTQKFVKKMVAEIEKDYWSKQTVETRLCVWRKSWGTVTNYRPRTLDSVILPVGEKEKLLQAIDNFTKAEPRYRSLGIPYHFGVELDGPPGTGKTSLASALAHHYKKNLYILSLTDMHSDDHLQEAMAQVYKDSIVLFEDIDAAGIPMRKTAITAIPKVYDPAGIREVEEGEQGIEKFLGKGVTLSGLLNVLDGLQAPDSVIYLMTTNHHENLDPALLRPGRIDYRLTMEHAHITQKAELFHRFFPNADGRQTYEALAKRSTTETMAEFQGFLLRMLGDGGDSVHSSYDHEEVVEAPNSQDSAGKKDPKGGKKSSGWGSGWTYKDGSFISDEGSLIPEASYKATPGKHGMVKKYAEGSSGVRTSTNFYKVKPR